MHCDRMIVFLRGFPGVEDGSWLESVHEVSIFGRIYVLIPKEDRIRVAEICRRCEKHQAVKMYVTGEITLSHTTAPGNFPQYRFTLGVSHIDVLCSDPLDIR